jgi:hypothetical protein
MSNFFTVETLIAFLLGVLLSTTAKSAFSSLKAKTGV